MDSVWGQGPAVSQGIPERGKDDFEARNKTHAKIEPDKIETSFEITLIALDKATGGVTFVPALIQIAPTPFCTLERRAPPCGVGYLIFPTKENGQCSETTRCETRDLVSPYHSLSDAIR